MATINPVLTGKNRSWVNAPQSIALVSDAFIFITGGFNLAISVGWTYEIVDLHLSICWFNGVAIGAVLAPLLTNWKRRRFSIFSPILLVNVSAIINMAGYYNTDALIAARYLNGIGIGLTTVSFIIHASEIASEHYRGYCMALEQIGLYGGAYVQIICTSYWSSGVDINIYCLQGIFSIIFGVIALAVTFTSIDSPIQHLRRGDEPEALNCVVRLYRPPIMTNEKQVIFNKLKEYVAMNESMSLWKSFIGSLIPLLKVLCYRCMLSFIIAFPITLTLQWSESIGTAGSLVNWPPTLYGLIGCIGVLVAFTTLDPIGRKAVSLFSLLCVAGMYIGVGVIFNDPNSLFNSTKMATACALLMISNIFGGIFAPSTTLYLGEAFPLYWKSYFIAFTVIVQYVVDLIIVCTFTFTSNNVFVFCIATGVIMFIGCLVFAVTMPETRKNTLKETQEQFAYALHLRFY
ncbi:high-affinity glucose transporter HXT2 [Ceratitis capitata]|uniref:high-affinity glucose transporter HXT2 n=1 Tax=Ceratitis capitata TaxID=7213 RepID=UPI00032A1F97|nr:high-affinity glucose transporter HXT2 [Ceratitis capitata]